MNTFPALWRTERPTLPRSWARTLSPATGDVIPCDRARRALGVPARPLTFLAAGRTNRRGGRRRRRPARVGLGGGYQLPRFALVAGEALRLAPPAAGRALSGSAWRRGEGNRRGLDEGSSMAQDSKTRTDANAGQWSAATPAGYMPGFGNDFETEALPGALPVGQNSPQRTAYGLYAEQLSGSPFTAPRGSNERSWLYRIRPSVKHTPKFKHTSLPLWKTAPATAEHERPIGQLRWGPVPIPSEPVSFLTGLRTITTAGDVNTQAGMAAHVYLITQSMPDDYFYNADAEMLIVPQLGRLCFFTEFGRIEVAPGEICVIPRGVKFKVDLLEGPARGYLCENYGAKFSLPERGPIGANCLANARDFKTPVAAFE